MALIGPAFLTIGTEVSAKYRGAFCEAKVKKAVKCVKLRVTGKDSPTSIWITDDQIVVGVMKVGSVVQFKQADSGQMTEGVVNKVNDNSTYTVVFDDGDERTLRRNQLVLKGDKHFDVSETLDNLPLSHPEHFGTPVLKTKKTARNRAGDSDSDGSSSEDESQKRASYISRHQALVGKVMLAEVADKRKGGSPTPVLVVMPDAHPVELKHRDQLLVRSFRDTKFLVVYRKDLKGFSREAAIKNEDKALKAAFEKALLFFDNSELPSNWNRAELLGPDDGEEGEETSDDETQCEQRDHFVAQLYKFMDDRGTPINKGPCIGNKDLNLYRLFKVVQNIGGYNKATNQMKWRLVYSKMGLPPSNQAAHQIKNAYKKYLHAFEDFYRKLGSIMGTISRPGRQSRQTPSRGILAFRGRDASPRSPRPEKPTVSKEDKAKEEEKAKAKAEESNTVEQTVAAEAKETTPAEEADDTVRRSTPRREKAQSQKEEPKSDKKEDGKVKKEDQKVKKEEVKKEDQKVKKEEDKKEEASKEEKKKEEKREERKSLRQSQKDKEEEKKEAVKTKEEEKKDVKKEEGKTVRVLRKDLNDKEEEEKKEPEDTKEAQKKRVSRRKQTRVEEEKKEGEDKEEEEEKVEEKKAEEKKAEEKKAEEKKVEEKKEKKKAPTSAKKEKAAPKKKAEEEENEAKDKESENESDDDSSSSSTQDQEVLSVGTRLKVRYGRGRNHKIYEAKVIEHKNADPHKKYRVHYAGWNTRYDEWVETERIVKVIDRPELTKLKKKPLTAKSLKASTAQAAVKNEIPFLKKRGRQPSTQQAPSPGATGTGSGTGTGTKPSPSPTPSPSPSPAAGEAKVPKVKASLTPTSALSKTRSMRSTSTEIKPEAAATATSAAKQRITRRSSGVNESADEPVTGEAEEGSESAMDVECAPAGDGEADGVSEHPEQDEVTEPAPDTKVEEEEEETPPSVEAAVETKPPAPQEEDSVVVKPDESKRLEVDDESLPPVTAVTETECATETEPVPQPSPPPRQASPAPEDNAVSLKDSSEPPPHPASPPQVEEPQVPPVTEEVREEQKTEESDPQLATVAKEEVVVKKDTPAEEEKAVEPGCVEMPAVNQPEGEKTAPLPDPAIPHLKKIDLDQPPAEDKKEGKEKAKPGKKLGREFKKSRQSEMRTSFSEIPTLEPMTSPEGDVKPAPADVKPSPYDFNDTEADSPSSWQPEITKKWEPNNRSASLYRDVKNALKKSLETDKKKVKKKNKKAAEEASGESESPSKPSEKKAKDPSVVKKGRRKRTAEGEVKVDTSSYEETVNSVVESCKNDDFTGISVPLPPSLETKEEKVTKKRKKMLQCNASPEADTAQEGKKEPAKPVKALKGKVGRKKKEVKTGESVTDQNANPNPLSVPSFHVHIPPSSSHQDKPPSSSDPCEALSVKQPCSEGGLPSATLTGSCAQGLLVPTPMAGPSGLHMLSMASIRPVPSTSGAAGAGPSDRLAPLLEGVACEGVKQAPPDPPRVDCAGDMPKRVGSTVLDNTPPTTPENDLDEANSASSSSEAHDNLKEDLDSLDSAERTCKGGSESPPGCDFSLSSTSSENLPSSSSGAQSNGPPSQSSEPVSAKRKKKEDPAAASVKKKRRLASRSTRGERNKKSPKYGDDDSHSRSPLHHNHSDSGLVPTANSEAMKSGIPRQRKFHFTDDLGEHLEGEERIQFLLDKMKEIRRVYQCIKARAAAIDRKRKRARRMEKERESAVDQSLILPDNPEHSRPAPAFTAEQAPASSPEQVGTCQPEVTPVEAGTSRPASSPEQVGTCKPEVTPDEAGTSPPASSPDGIGTSPPASSPDGIGTSPPASSPDGIGTSPPASSPDGIGTSPPASSPEGIGTSPPAPTYPQGCWVLVGLAVTGSRQQRHVDYVGKVLFHDEETEEVQIKWLKSRGTHYTWPPADYVTWESVRDIKKIMRNPETCGSQASTGDREAS